MAARKLALLALASCLVSCVTPDEAHPTLSPAQIARRIPAHVRDRDGWARDVAAALAGIDREATPESVCGALAIIEQESNFQADPVVPDLPRIVRDGLRAKLQRLGPLADPAVNALLSGHAPGSAASFADRIDKLRTEGDLDRFFRDMTNAYRDRLPGPLALATALGELLGGKRVDDLNPVTTVGSMQVSVAFAHTIDGFRDLDDGALRDLLYTRAGGVRAGTARLYGNEAGYDAPVYRFADYNAGVYASRNAAFQAVLADLTGQRLALDGDLLAYDEHGDPTGTDTASLKAMLTVARLHDLWEWRVRRSASSEKSLDFESTPIWEEARAAWKTAHGREPPYARIPTVALHSPKLAKARSTEWFARSVSKRYQACLTRR